MRLSAAGDFSSSPGADRVLRAMAASSPDAMLALGDLSYGPTGQEQAWCDFVTERVGAGAPFELLSGNHESDGQNGHVNDFSACLPNQLPGLRGTYGRQYAVDLPQQQPLVRYLAISPGLTFPDGTWSYAAGTPRYRWVADEIDAARAAGIRWVVVGMHKPCLSVGQYPCEVGDDLLQLLLAKRVDVVLSGHEHLYSRMAQLALGPGCDALLPGGYDADCVADADDDLQAGAGTVLTVVGTGGAVLRDVDLGDPEYPYVRRAIAQNVDPTFGHAELDLTATGLSFALERPDGSVADAFTLTSPIANRAPVAAFSASGTGSARRLDAVLATDTDGALAVWDWDLGDGSTATGPVVDHTWAAPGTYAVRLTVTDAEGATGSAVQQVTVDDAGQVLAADDFERTTTRSWGAADVGGPWTVSTAVGTSSVAGGLGRTQLTSTARSTLSRLPGASATGTDLTTEVSLAALPGGGSSGRVDVGVVPRRTTTGDEYRAVVRVGGNGATRLFLGRLVAGSSTRIGTEAVLPGTPLAASAVLEVRVQAVGAGPTTVRAKAWPRGTAEPTAWQVSGTDATPALQQPGSLALRALATPTSTGWPLEVRFDALRMVPAP
ncbi:PKD domain-containing protein [Nocardioides sp. AX2bis]|uniref:PKD domain-containing protein n=1 Tax=Nocardioides sp. AX2bis TaxID=2653157 RepID=UPI00135B3296|nr:PKD domain-containing protein [Nocardioides sp. AX2bis]